MQEKTFIVQRPELHYSHVKIAASSREEALQRVINGEGEELDLHYYRTFEPDEKEWSVEEAPNAEGLEELVRWFEEQIHERGLDVEDFAMNVLDDLVHDVMSRDASCVNNGGYKAQLEYLLTSLGLEGVKQELNHVLYGSRRDQSGPLLL